MPYTREQIQALMAASQAPADPEYPVADNGRFAFEDGDSRALPGDGQTRVQGFDAPELAHPSKGLAQEPGAIASRDLSAQFTADPNVRRTGGGLDYYGRPLERFTGEGSTLAQEQLRRGLATPMDADPANRRAFYEGLAERDNPSTPEQAALNEQLDAEWANAKPNYHNVRKQKKRGLGEVFGDAIDRGLDQMGMMAGGTQKLIGEGLGIDMLTEAGERRIRENQIDVAFNAPDVGTLENVKTTGDGVTWAIEKLGEQGPNVAAMLGTALATGGIGTIAEVGGAALIGETLATRAAMQGLQVVGKAMTREVGAVAAGATLNVGESKLNLDEADPNGDHNLLALGTGVLKTGLDVFSLKQMPGVGKLLAPRARAAGLTQTQALKAWGDIPTDVLRATLTEGSTEGMQTLLDQAAANYKAGKEYDWAEVRESMAAGALVGGTMGALGGTAEMALQRKPGEENVAPEGNPPVEPPAPVDPAAPTQPPAPPSDNARAAEALRNMRDLHSTAGPSPVDVQPPEMTDEEWASLGADATLPQEEIDGLLRGLQVQDDALPQEEIDGLLRGLQVQDTAPSNEIPPEAFVHPEGAPVAPTPPAADGKFKGTTRYNRENTSLAPYEERGVTANDEREAKTDQYGKGASGVAAVRRDIRGAMRSIKSVGRLKNRIADAEQRLQELTAQAQELNQIRQTRALDDGESRAHTSVEGQLRGTEADLAFLYDWLKQHHEKQGLPPPKRIRPEAPQAAQPQVKPEPKAQVEAQAAAVAEGVKPLGFVAKGTKLPALGEGQRAVTVPGGRIYGSDEQIKAFTKRRKELGLGKALAEAQGATRTKEEVVAAATPEDPAVVVRKRDAAGNTITGVVALQSEAGRQTPPGPGAAEVVSVEEELKKREEPSYEETAIRAKSALPVRGGQRIGAAPPALVGPPRPKRAREPGGVRKPAPRPAEDTRPSTSVPRQKSRAAVRLEDGTIVHNPLVREAKLGVRQKNAPANGPTATERLMTRLRAMPWVNKHLLLDAEPGSWTTVELPDGSKVDRTVGEQNDLILSLARHAIEDYVAEEMLGQTPADRQAKRTKKTLDDPTTFRSIIHGIASNAPDRAIESALEPLRDDKAHQLAMVGRSMGVSQDRNVGTSRKGKEMEADDREVEFEAYAGENHAIGDEQETSVDDEGGIGKRSRAAGKQGKSVTPEQDRWWKDMALALASALEGNGIPARKRGETSVEEQFELLRTTPIPKEGPKGGKRPKKGVWPKSNRPQDIAAWLQDVVYEKDGTPIEDVLFEGTRRLREAGLKEKNRHIEAAYLASVDAETGELDRSRGDAMKAAVQSEAEFWEELKRTDPESYEEVRALARDIEDGGRQRDRDNADKARQEEMAAAQEALKEATKAGDARRIAEAEKAVAAAAEINEREAARAEASRVAEQEAQELAGEGPSLEELLAMDRGEIEEGDILAKPVESLMPFMHTPEQGVALYRVHMADRDEVLNVSEAPAVDYLNAILAQIPKGHALQRRVVEALLRALKDTGLVVEVDGSELEQRGNAGEYHPMTNRILFSPKYLKSEWGVPLLLHELVHAATYHALRSNPAFRAQMLSMMHGVKNAAKGTPAEGHYGFTSVDEFLSEALSNPDFQVFLASVGRNQSLWSRFVRAVARMLGLSGTDTYDDMLTAVIEATLPQLRTPKKAKYTREGALALPTAEIRQTLDAMSRTAPARAARLAAARNYREAGQALVGGAKRFIDKTLDIFEPVLVANWQLARAGTRELADVFFRQSGTRNALGVMNRATLREMAFRIAWHRMFKSETPEAMAEAWGATERARAAGQTREQLAAENELAGRMQTFFERMSLYIQAAGVKGYAPVEGIYLPQIHDTGAIAKDFEGYVQFLVDGEFTLTDQASGQERPISGREATTIAHSITTPHEHATHADLPYAGSLMHRVITDPRYQAAAREAGWLHNNPTQIVQYYVASLAKQVEFERRFGGYMLDLSAEADATGEIPALALRRATSLANVDHRIMPHLRKIYGGEIKSMAAYNRAFDIGLRTGLIEAQGIDAEGHQLFQFYQRDLGLEIEIGTALQKYGNDKKAKKAAEERIRTIISGYMGQLGADMNPTRRKAQQWVLMAQTVTTLAFSTISSIPEFGLLMAMAPDRAALVAAVRKVATDRASTKALMEDIGFGWDQTINVALLDNSQYNMMEGMPRKIIDKFFMLNGQHAWTYTMRALTAQMAMSHFTRLAEQNDTATLALHGLTPASVRDWQEHRTMFGMGGTGLAVADVHPMVMALHNFIDDVVIVPDAASRPTFMNDPKWALVGQLKSFFYAYGSKVMGGMWRRQSAAYQAAVARGDHKGAATIKAAVPYLVLGSMGIVLAALAGELKERLKYDIWGEERPAWREKHGLEYWLDTARKSGMLGPMDMAVNLFDDEGSGVMGLLGPAAGHLEVGLTHGFFSEQFARRSTPVLGQLPGARAKLAELTGYGDDDEL